MQLPRSLTDNQNTSRKENFLSLLKLKYDMMMISEPMKESELSIIVMHMRVLFCCSVSSLLLPSPESSSSPIAGGEALREFVMEPGLREEDKLLLKNPGEEEGGSREVSRGKRVAIGQPRRGCFDVSL